jgi:hypothetical protein
MSATHKNHQGYSADVRMQLNVNGHAFVVGHLGPGFVILDNPTDHPPALAQMTLSIDGHVERWQVQLPEGISADRCRTPIQDKL